MSPQIDNKDGFVEFNDPKFIIKPRVYFSGRFPYSRKHDRAASTISTDFGEVTIGMWLGGANKVQQQDAVCLGVDLYENLWMVVVDGLGGHPGGAEASQICCDVLKENMTEVGFDVDVELQTKIRVRMARDRTIMSNPKKIGGACIALVCLNGDTHRLKSYSMGDVEVCVLRNGKELILANAHDTGNRNNQVTKSLSPAKIDSFTTSEIVLNPGDKVLLASDGLANKAFMPFGETDKTTKQQVNQAINISKDMNGNNADNMSIMCLDSFFPKSLTPNFSTVHLGKV